MGAETGPPATESLNQPPVLQEGVGVVQKEDTGLLTPGEFVQGKKEGAPRTSFRRRCVAWGVGPIGGTGTPQRFELPPHGSRHLPGQELGREGAPPEAQNGSAVVHLALNLPQDDGLSGGRFPDQRGCGWSWRCEELPEAMGGLSCDHKQSLISLVNRS
jgi:hypothetical protein